MASPNLLAGQDMTADLMSPPAWTAMVLVNSWANNGSGFVNAQYRLWKLINEVEVIGVISGGTNNTVCFTLPAGFTPATSTINPVYGGTSTNCAITVASTGTMTVANFTAGQPVSFHFWISLDA